MTVPFNQDIDSYVAPGGRIILQALFQTFAGSGAEQPVSGVQIEIAPVAGGSPVVGPTSAGVVAIDTATYQYAWNPSVSITPGDYLATWTATGAYGPLTQVVRVVAAPAQSPVPGVYASVADYQTYTGDLFTPTTRVQVELQTASIVLDNALIGAVYPTDADSMPTYPAHIDAFRRACIEQVKFQLANDDPALVKSQYASTSLGGVSLSRTARAQGQTMPPLAPLAAAILHIVGAGSVAPLISW